MHINITVFAFLLASKGPENCYIGMYKNEKLLMVSVTNAKNSVILFNWQPCKMHKDHSAKVPSANHIRKIASILHFYFYFFHSHSSNAYYRHVNCICDFFTVETLCSRFRVSLWKNLNKFFYFRTGKNNRFCSSLGWPVVLLHSWTCILFVAQMFACRLTEVFYIS
jgi:hypothetical protein